MKIIVHSWFLMIRSLRHLMRQPWYIAFTLLQPIIWLVLYGQLFQKVVALPGFHAKSYIDFLTPGVVIMSTLFGAGWTGMGTISDLDRGVMDRFLISPVSRLALVMGRLLNLAVNTVIQALILFGLGYLLGARYESGLTGLAVLLLSAILLGMPVGALSTALALTMRKEESLIGAVNFVLLPLTFVSPVFMANDLMPQWMRTVSVVNPVKWSVEAGRNALLANPDWQAIAFRLLLLLLFGVVCAFLATLAFRSYERSA